MRSVSLTFDEVDLDRDVARQLSPAVGARYHALPVGVAEHQITVLMADPTDIAGREAIASDLGVEPRIVRGDRLTIDRMLAELWCEDDASPSRLLAYVPADSDGDQLRSYAEYVASLLDATLEYAVTEDGVATLVRAAPQGFDLLILGKTELSTRKGLFSTSIEQKATEGLSLPVLVAREPRWPLQRVLLVIQGGRQDEVATHWSLRLAASSGASVTALAVVPPVPAMYGGLARMESGLAGLLATDTSLGGQMRNVARRLVDARVEGTLLLRQGSPDWEIRREMTRERHDLLVIAALPRHVLRRRVMGDLPISLLRAVDRPMLVAR